MMPQALLSQEHLDAGVYPTDARGSSEAVVSSLPAAGHLDSGLSDRLREKQEEERTYPHAEVLSKVLALQTLFELEQLNFEGAAHATVKFAMETLQCHGAAIGLVEENHICYCASSGRRLIRDKHMPLTTSPSALCIESKAAFVSADVPRDERLPLRIRNIEWLRSLVVIPIFQRKDVAATLEMYFTKPGGFEVKDINTYEVLGILIGKVLLTDTNAKISDELESERAETNARLEQLKPQLELLSGKTEISAFDERDSEFDPISALLITEPQVPTAEVPASGPSGEISCAQTGSISASFSPITTMQETLPKTSKNQGVVSRKGSALSMGLQFNMPISHKLELWSRWSINPRSAHRPPFR